MNKKSLANLERRLYSALTVSAVLVLVVIGMLLHWQVLSSRIAMLEKEGSVRASQLATYERSLCSTVTEVGKLTKYSIQSAGYDRTYQVHTPDNYDPSVRYPVIISFDGIEGSGNRMEGYSGLDGLPALVVYLDALPGKGGFTAWEGAPYSVEGDRDVQFVSDTLKTLPSQYCTDSTRTYAVGMSNGGAFATTVGCKLGDQIKAVASVSGAYYTPCSQEERTPSLLIAHSVDDRQAPFKGSTIRRLPQVPQYVDAQAAERHCKVAEPAEVSQGATYYQWSGCDDNSLLRFIVLKQQPHGWLTLPRVSVQQTQGSAGYIWQFFEESTFNN